MTGVRAAIGALVVALLVASACATAPGPDGSPNAATELGVGPPTASAEARGIVVEVWLDRREVMVGDLVLALVRVSNQGDFTVRRETNTCGTGPARTTVVRTEADPGRPAGHEWGGIADDFKQFVLGRVGLGDGPRELGTFWDARAGGEPVFCRLISQVRPFGPGSADQMLVAWRAMPAEGAELLPGPAIVRATFEEAAADRPAAGVLLEVIADAPIEIVVPEPDGDEEPAGPRLVDYVDAALSEPAFRDWLEAAPPDTWMSSSVTFWPTQEGSYPEIPPFNRFGRRPVVEISLHRQHAPGDRNPEGEIRSVIIDRATAEVLAVRDPMREP